MNKKIGSALISVYYKNGLDAIVKSLHSLGVTLYSTGGTQKFIEQLGIPVIPVEDLTTYPSILGGRVKTLHPAIFGGILGRRNLESDLKEMKDYRIPEIDLVIVDLYPFGETLKTSSDEQTIIEKIDIGGVSLIRAAGKNYQDVLIVASPAQYPDLLDTLAAFKGETSTEIRRTFASKAFEVCAHYDIAISNYFNPDNTIDVISSTKQSVLRYGENPHQKAVFYGDTAEVFEQLNGKEISYNNLVDIDAALQLIAEFAETGFAIIKHTNVCGVALRPQPLDAWKAALAGDPESAFGGVLVCNATINKETAEAINDIFFEVLLAPGFDDAALATLQSKKNRILLKYKAGAGLNQKMSRTVINGTLVQDTDKGDTVTWEYGGTREATEKEKADLEFANIVCKHLKSNAIALATNKQLIGKGSGQTSRIDAVRQAIEKAKHFDFDLTNAVLASDAFFPFDDSVKLAHEAGIKAFIQPGGSIRDKDSIAYCIANGLTMVITGLRHFKH
jgi:phosphoribosylaminoimidazolecarboxamide formyltransferase / IMP cyclohydrolase